MAEQIIERGGRLSESILWKAQRAYFESAGAGAWKSGTVPHYVTSNPFVAEAYASVAFGFLRDLRAQGGPDSPLILELGAGSGRFAFHFLEALAEACDRFGGSSFRYLLSDAVAENVAFCRSHPKLAPFAARGLLDFAVIDVERALPVRPSIVIANYVFDGLPQDAYLIRGGRAHEALATVRADAGVEDPTWLSSARLELTASADPVPAGADALLDHYAAKLDDTTLLLPVAALRAIERLEARTLVLIGDKGWIDLQSLDRRLPPELALHGSFSLPVSFDPLAEHARRSGGLALSTHAAHASLHTLLLITGGANAPWLDTRLAFHHAFERAAPDDVFRLRRGLQGLEDAIGPLALLSLLRLGAADPRIVADHAKALSGLAEVLGPEGKRDLRDLIRRAADRYYHLGERDDWMFSAASIVYAAGFPADALALLERSVELHGPRAETLHNMELCREEMVTRAPLA